MKCVLILAMWLAAGLTPTLPGFNLASGQGWDAFVGTWKIADPLREEEAQIKTAIYQATEEMSFLTRGIARGRLISTQKPPKQIRMRRQNEMFVIHSDPFPAMSLPLSGKAIKNEDRMIRVSLEAGGERPTLHYISETEQGKQENVYRLQDNGQSMLMEVTVDSPHLPARVKYKLRFTRVE
ncbi:MAG TPA: hypothetical protein VJ302_25740 [Blastocatellia bacterium]|nr:hypothetical protein [Blastocatellia bacterium]